MITISVSGRRATASELVPLPTGNVQSIKVQIDIPTTEALWQNALIVAVFAAKTPKGAWIVCPSVIDEFGQASIPGDVLRVAESDVYVGVRGTYADNREVTTNIAFLGKTSMGAGGEIVDTAIRDTELTHATEFLSALYAFVSRDVHTHTNKEALDKLSDKNGRLLYDGVDVNVVKIVAKPNALDPDAQSGSIAVATSDGKSMKPVALPVQEAGEEAELAIGDVDIVLGTPEYNESAVLSAIASLDSEHGMRDVECTLGLSEDTSIGMYLMPVVTDISYNAYYTTAEIELDASDVILAPGSTTLYAIMAEVSDNNLAHIRSDKITQIDSTHVRAPYLAIYTYETMDATIADSIEARLHEGWNIIYAVFDTADDYDFDLDTTVVTGVNINEYVLLQTDADSTIRLIGTGASQIYDGIVEADTVMPRGLYVLLNGTWVHYPTLTNKAVLDLFASSSGVLTYDGKTVPLVEPDDVTPLGFVEYSDLVIRDEVMTGESIQDVPIYIHGDAGEICRLTAYDDGTDDDYIALLEVRQYSTDTPIRIIKTSINGTIYIYSPVDYYDAFGQLSHPSGWSDTSGQATDKPSFVGFAPDRFSVGSGQTAVSYDDLDDLIDSARSALRSMSQCINVSASAMGTIRVPDDAVERYAGAIRPNHKYAYQTDADVTITLPQVPWTDRDAQFVVYLDCTADIDMTISGDVQFVGGSMPDTTAGLHKIIGSYMRSENTWLVGGVDYEAVTA